jgi:hypothetical protein
MNLIITEEEMLAKFHLNYHNFIKYYFNLIRQRHSYNKKK